MVFKMSFYRVVCSDLQPWSPMCMYVGLISELQGAMVDFS